MKRILQDLRTHTKIQKEALVLLQKAAEEYVTSVFVKTQWFAEHAARKTVRVEDLKMVLTLTKQKTFQ